MTKIHFIKDYPKEDADTHVHTHRVKRIFSDDRNLRQPCNLGVNTNKLPVWTFLYLFVLRSLECKITMFSDK